MLYWSDVANDVLMQSRLDGSEVRTLVESGLAEPGIQCSIIVLQCSAYVLAIVLSDYPTNNVRTRYMCMTLALVT